MAKGTRKLGDIMLTVLIKVQIKSGHPTLNYSFIVFLTLLEMAHGEIHRWRAGFALCS